MSFDADFLPLLASMAVTALFTRLGGFWLMGLIPSSPALEAALKATPLAVMVGIAAPAAAQGHPPEIVGLAAVLIAMRLTGNDIASALVGVAVVAGLRLVLP